MSEPYYLSQKLRVAAPPDGFVVMISVFIDESQRNKGEGPFLTVAGYVFEKDSAQRFNEEWGDVLKREGVPFFHMKDLVNCKSLYRGWDAVDEDGETRAIKFEKSLIEYIHRHSKFGFCVGVDEKACQEIVGENAYVFLITRAILICHDWAKRTSYEGRFGYFFESGWHQQSDVEKVLAGFFIHPNNREKFGFASHRFVKKTDPDARACQCADLLSYLAGHTYFRIKKNEKPRKDMQALFRNDVDIFEMYDAEALKNMKTPLNS